MGVKKTGFTLDEYKEYGPWVKEATDGMSSMQVRVQKAFGTKSKLIGLAEKAWKANSAFFHALMEELEDANPDMHPPEIREIMGYKDHR